VEEIHESKLDKVKGGPIERGENEGPLGDVQDRMDILSERDCSPLVHGFNEIESVQKLVTAGERDYQTYTSSHPSFRFQRCESQSVLTRKE
jgi:hypothetical protein